MFLWNATQRVMALDRYLEKVCVFITKIPGNINGTKYRNQVKTKTDPSHRFSGVLRTLSTIYDGDFSIKCSSTIDAWKGSKYTKLFCRYHWLKSLRLW